MGLHLDVLKNDKLIQVIRDLSDMSLRNFIITRASCTDVSHVDATLQKLMVDEKKCYLFGRNQQLNDFCIDHASCSRVHAALVYHKHLNRAFLVDLGSSKYRAFIGVKGTIFGNCSI